MALNDIDITEFVKDVMGEGRPRLDEKQLAIKYQVSTRTIRDWKEELRDTGKIEYLQPYLKKMQESISSINTDLPEENKEEIKASKANFTKEELLKLLNLHGSKKEVAFKLGMPQQAITEACNRLRIVSDEDECKILLDKFGKLSSSIEPYNNLPQLKGKSQQSYNMVLTDFHAGKEIIREDNIYNLNEFNNRMDKIAHNSYKLFTRHVQVTSTIEQVNLFLVGDLVDGTGIYHGQEYHQSCAFPGQVIAVFTKLVQLIQLYLKAGYPVSVYCAKGNHGRVGDNPGNDFDLLIYMMLDNWKNMNKVTGLKVVYSTEDYLDVTVGRYRVHLRHKAFQQGRTSAGRAKFLAWSKDHANADAIISGHFHTPSYDDINKIDVISGGCLPGQDDFADSLGVSARPAQVVFGSSDKRFMTFFYKVDLL